MNKRLAALRIVLLAIAAAIVYGIAHDLVTAHVCVEYFTIGHPQILPTEDPVALAIAWGVIATWWVGLLLGLPLAFAALRGPRPPRTALSLVRPIATLLAVMAVFAAAAGAIGYACARQGSVFLLEPLASQVPAERHAAFIGDLWAHVASYLIGFVGGIVLTVRTWRSRRRV